MGTLFGLTKLDSDVQESLPMLDLSRLTDKEHIRDSITLAKNMRNNGASFEAIKSRLMRKGLDQSAIIVVLGQIPAEEPDNIVVSSDPSVGGRLILIVVGLLISGIGLFMVIVSRTGDAPPFEFMGFSHGHRRSIGGAGAFLAGRVRSRFCLNDPVHCMSRRYIPSNSDSMSVVANEALLRPPPGAQGRCGLGPLSSNR